MNVNTCLLLTIKLVSVWEWLCFAWVGRPFGRASDWRALSQLHEKFIHPSMRTHHSHVELCPAGTWLLTKQLFALLCSPRLN